MRDGGAQPVLCLQSRTSGRSANARPRARSSAPKRAPGVAGGATPARARRCAQNGWSPANGATTDGTAERAAEWVVPEPPWCPTQAVRGNSQSCGVSPSTWMFSGRSDTSMRLQPG